MDLSDVYSFIEGQENGADMLKVVKTEMTKRNNENKNLRTRANEAEKDLEAKSGQLSKVFEKVGYDPDNKDDNFDDKFTKAITPKEGDPGKPSDVSTEIKLQIEELNRSLKAEKKLREESEAKSKASETKAEREKIKNTIMTLTKDEVVSEEAVSTLIMLENLKTSDDGVSIFELEGEQYGTAKEFIKPWLEAHPELKKNTQHSGSGDNDNGGLNGRPSNLPETASAKDRIANAFSN